MNYVTHEQLYLDVMQLERKLPRDIAAVIGVPRSGMIAASMIALHRNIPLGAFVDGKATQLNNGGRIPIERGWSAAEKPGARWLVIDDSIYRGGQMKAVRAYMAEDFPDRPVVYAAVYGHPDTPAKSRVDYVAREIPSPRYFAWNIFHHADLKDAMLDMDGVLCYDPPVFDDGRGGKYEDWLPHAEPLHLPTVPFAAICTNRLQIWREQTSTWLKRHGLQCGELHMSPFDTPAERNTGSPYGQRKGEVYAESTCKLFIESDDYQAQRIAQISKKPVLALDTGKVY